MKRRISQGQAIRSTFGRAARHPDRAAIVIAARHLIGLDQKPLGFAPSIKSTLKAFGGNALVPQPGGNALRELLSLLADDDYLLVGELTRPSSDCFEVPLHGGRQQARVGVIVFVNANIDDGRCIWQTDKAGKLRYGDFSC